MPQQRKRPSIPDTTVGLVRQAKNGNRDALEKLLGRYYKKWLRKYHGNLGAVVRKLYDTEDLVQSAIVEVMTELPRLEHERAFFTWVTSIIRHKHAKRYRRLKNETSLDSWSKTSSTSSLPLTGKEGEGPEDQAAAVDRYVQTLDVILSLFPENPERMAVFVLKHLEGWSIQEIVERFGRPQSTVYKLLNEGKELLRARIEP